MLAPLIPFPIRAAILAALQAKRDEAKRALDATQHAGLRDFWQQRLAEYDAALAWTAPATFAPLDRALPESAFAVTR